MEPLTVFDEEDKEEDLTVGGPVPPQEAEEAPAEEDEYVYDLPEGVESTPYEEPAAEELPQPDNEYEYELPDTIEAQAYEEPLPEEEDEYEYEIPAYVEATHVEDEIDRVNLVPPMEEGKTYLVADDIRNNPERMQIIRDYMVMRNGDQYTDISDEDLYDDYINAMRYINSNEISLSYDVGLLALGEEGTKEKMARAYELYGQLGNFYQNDGFIGGADAIKDYTWSVLTSPMTYLGFGVGKLYSQAAMQGGKKAAIAVLVREAKAAAMKELVDTGLHKAGSAAVKARTAELARQGVKGAIRSSVNKELAVMSAGEAVGGAVSDSIAQHHFMNVGVQDDYSLLQTGISTALGGALTAVPGALSYRSLDKGAIPEVRQLQLQAGNAALAEAKYGGKIDMKGLTKGLKTLKGKLFDWDKAVKDGKKVDLGGFGRSQQLLVGVFGTQNGDMGLVPTMMRDAGVVLQQDERVVQQMITFVDQLPEDMRVNLDDAFTRQFGEGVTLSNMKESLSATVSQMGSTFQAIQESGRLLSESVARKTRASELIKAGKKEPIEAPIAKINDVMHYTQNAWKRALVSHPATTAVNVMGWAQATGARQLALMTSGAYYGVTGWAAKLASPFSATAKTLSDAHLTKAKNTFKAYAYTLNTLLHPFATRDEFEMLINGWDTVYRSAGKGDKVIHTEAVPKKFATQLDRASYSQTAGVGKTRIEDSDSLVVRGIERYLDGAQAMSLVRFQDSITKSISFMEALNTSLLRRTGKGYSETVAQGGTHAIPEEAWEEATRFALRDVMSADYTKGPKTFFSTFANTIETVSNNSLLGWFMPFGRFMNNALAFTYQYSPIGMLRVLGKHPNESTVDILSQAAVGSAALYFAFAREQAKAEKGIPWYVEEGNDGVQYDFTNLAPGAAFSLMGRIIHHINQGDNPVDKDVVKDLLMQLGSASVLATMSKADEGLTDKLINMFNVLAGEDSNHIGVVQGTLLGLAQAGAGIFAGFTRPLEPFSSIAAGSSERGQLYIDRAGLEGMDSVKSEATRYVDGLLAPFLEESTRPPRYDAINPRGHKDPNPMGRLLGLRQAPAQTDAERMFAEAFFPEWKANQKSNVAALDSVVNEKVQTLMEIRATRLRNSSAWQKGDLSTRRKLVTDLLKSVREETVQWATQDDMSDAALYKLQDTYSRRPADLRKRAQEAYGIDKPFKELSAREIMELTEYMDYLDGQDKELMK